MTAINTDTYKEHLVLRTEMTAKAADQQPLLDDRDEVTLLDEMSVVLMGHHGVGKNTVGNAILKKNAFRSKDSSKDYYLKHENTTFGRHIIVTRVPGWHADLNSEKNFQHWQVIKDSLRIEQIENEAKSAEKCQQKMEEVYRKKICEMENKLQEKDEEIEKLTHSLSHFLRLIQTTSGHGEPVTISGVIGHQGEIEKLKKENQEQNKRKTKAKTSFMSGPKKKDTNSFELDSLISAGVQFVKKNRNELIERIVAVKPIADDLFPIIGSHKYEKILQAPTEYDQKRLLYDITEKGGTKSQYAFYKSLLKHEEYLVEDLEEKLSK
ncbi:immune-associated nucleotide-binding protein 11-like [Tachysurus ichikawai]